MNRRILAHPLKRLHQRVARQEYSPEFEQASGWQEYPPNVLVVIPSQQPSKSLESPNQGRCDTRNHAQRCEALCHLEVRVLEIPVPSS